MPNKRTKALTEEQYNDIIDTMKKGFTGCRPNNKIATALVLEANLGIRISDILNLKLNDIAKDGNEYRINIVEIKTKKKRIFTVPIEIYTYIQSYCIDNNIRPDEIIFPISERAVQKHLKLVCDWLGYKDIGTHSFRKFFATEIYKNNDYNILLVQKLLQHSTVAVTQRYISLSSKEIETALKNHIRLR